MHLVYRLLFASVALCGWGPGATAQSLVDPGPVWAGITDATSLGDRLRTQVAEAETMLGSVRDVSATRTTENTLLPFKRAKSKLAEAQRLARMGLNAHPDSAFRAYAQAWETRLAARAAALGTDRTIYDALAALDLDTLSPELRYVVEQDLAGYRRDGVNLDEATRARLNSLRARITDFGTQFERNIYTDIKTIQVHPDSLRGVPSDWVAAYAAGEPDADGLVIVTLTPANYSPLVTFAKSEDLRERAAQAYFSRGYPQNVPVLDSLRTLRHEMAALLGFDSWAAYSLEPMMAASPEGVARFLDDVDAASDAAAQRETAALLAVRQREEPNATSVPFAHTAYWLNRLKQQDHGFDQQAMRAYFPYSAVRDGILSAYGGMFGLEFRPASGMPVWSAEAEPYEVYEDNVLVGRFTLDMHPREGKYGHFAAFLLRAGGGDVPEGALLCNFPGGTEGDPGLLSPGQVSTFFHEFGHLIHILFAGRQEVLGNFERDFVEAPSQLLEEWASDYTVLRRFARHYETGEPIPADLVAAYRRSDGFGRALAARYNLWRSVLSLGLYQSSPEVAPAEAIEQRAGGYLMTPPPDYLHVSTSMTHLNRYSSNYYTYAWSEVIARDLLTGFDRDDLLSPVAGQRYRDLVLAPTGTAPSAVLIERFLGRPFNADAWREWLSEGDR